MQKTNIQVLYMLFDNNADDAVPEYKADMGADMGRVIYRNIQIVCDRKVFIDCIGVSDQKINEPVKLTDSRTMS